MENATTGTTEGFVTLLILAAIIYYVYHRRKKKKAEKLANQIVAQVVSQAVTAEVTAGVADSPSETSVNKIPNTGIFTRVRSKVAPECFNVAAGAYLQKICPSCGAPIKTIPKKSGTCKPCGNKYYHELDPYNGGSLLLSPGDYGEYRKSDQTVSRLENMLKYDLSPEEFAMVKASNAEWLEDAIIEVTLRKMQEYANEEGSRSLARNCMYTLYDLHWMMQDQETLHCYMSLLWMDTSGWVDRDLAYAIPAPYLLTMYDDAKEFFNLNDDAMERAFLETATKVGVKGKRSPERAWKVIMAEREAMNSKL